VKHKETKKPWEAAGNVVKRSQMQGESEKIGLVIFNKAGNVRPNNQGLSNESPYADLSPMMYLTNIVVSRDIRVRSIRLNRLNTTHII
jgi:hypothetical protein